MTASKFLATAALGCLLLSNMSQIALSQQASAWSELSIPLGTTSTAIEGQGKLVTYQDGSTLHVYSAVTRKWHATQMPPATTVRLFNDCVLMIGSQICRTFSSYTGRFTDLATQGSYTILNAGNNKNDSLILIASLSELHAFSVFTGTWTSRNVTPAFQATVQRHVAICADGSTISGMSAFDGHWHDLVLQANPISIDARGTAAFATTQTDLYAYSAHSRIWQSSPALTNANFARGDDWGVWYSSSAITSYSGLLGTFRSAPHGANSISAQSNIYALLSIPSGLCAYSAVTGDFLLIPQTPTSIDEGDSAALLHGANTVSGYSPLLQSVAPLQVTAANSGTSGVVGYVKTTNGDSYAWSSQLASWHQAPATSTGLPTAMTTTAIAYQTTSDCYAFCATSGQFIPCQRSLSGLAANTTSAPLVGYDATSLHAFDPDTERWVSSPRNSSLNPIFSIWRTSALAIEAGTAQGYGAQAGRWQPHNLQPGAASGFANSEVAFVVSPNHIAACSMLSEVIALQQFPHFRRIQPQNAPVTFICAPPADAIAIAAIATPFAPTNIPGLGTLLLDPTNAFLDVLLPLPGQLTRRISYDIPRDNVLVGATLTSQLLVLPSNEPPYLSSRATVHVW
jgi:hypothetical protein